MNALRNLASHWLLREHAALRMSKPVFDEFEEGAVVVNGLPHHRLPGLLADFFVIPVLASATAAAPSLDSRVITGPKSQTKCNFDIR